jgi:hypothetical protein
MSSPFSAGEPWRRQQPDYAESASTKSMTARAKSTASSINPA